MLYIARKIVWKKFCGSLRENEKNTVDFEKKKILPLTKEALKLQQDARNYHIFRNRILKSLTKAKIIKKLEVIVIIHINIETYCIVFVF